MPVETLSMPAERSRATRWSRLPPATILCRRLRNSAIDLAPVRVADDRLAAVSFLRSKENNFLPRVRHHLSRQRQGVDCFAFGRPHDLGQTSAVARRALGYDEDLRLG